MGPGAGIDPGRIAFVIPAYNDAPGLRRHFDYFARAGRPAELIVVDDASTDATGAAVREAVLPDTVTLRYHRNETNAGPGPTRNTGLDMVQSDFAMVLDADDLLTDTFFDYVALSPLVTGAADFVLFRHHLCRDPATLFSHDMHRGDNRFFSGMTACGFLDRTFTARDIPSILRIVNFPWNKVYRTAFLRAADIRFPDLRMHEDIRPHWHSCLRAERFGILNWAPPLIHHFETAGAGRATNYFGDDRLAAFDTLAEVLAEIGDQPQAALFGAELLALADDLLGWFCANLPEAAQTRFRDAAGQLHDAARQSLGDLPEASDPGRIVS